MLDPKPALADALVALTDARKHYEQVTGILQSTIGAMNYSDSMDAWKSGHEAILTLKAAHNALYKHLGELKPKTPKADKLKPGGEIDNPPAKKGRKEREAKVTEANSDEP